MQRLKFLDVRFHSSELQQQLANALTYVLWQPHLNRFHVTELNVPAFSPFLLHRIKNCANQLPDLCIGMIALKTELMPLKRELVARQRGSIRFIGENWIGMTTDVISFCQALGI